MKMMRALLLLLLGSMPSAVIAEVRELTQADLRAAVANDQAIASRRLIDGVETFTGGSVVHVRAFETNGLVTYLILVRQDDGQMGTIVLDAATGQVLTASSVAGQEVTDFARETPVSTSSPGNNGNGLGIGNGNNGNGRGGGNNGNGIGNSGGNNGNGNGGGNNGNGKGNN